jgi:flavin-dependent dehydrogenase
MARPRSAATSSTPSSKKGPERGAFAVGPGPIVIVGGGPAGLATALFLAAEAPALAPRIVVLERERYPRDKPCAGAIGARADKALWSIGLHVDVPSARIDGIEVRTSSGVVAATLPGAGRVVRRTEFDHALAQAARTRGIEVRDGVRVLSLEPGAHDVRLGTSEGALRAAVVVGADGVTGICRRALGVIETPHRAQAIEVDTEPVPGDPPTGVVRFDLSRRDLPGYTWDFPTIVSGRALVSRGVYYLKTSNPRHPVEIDAVLSTELGLRGLDLDRYEKRRYAERGFQGFHPSTAVGRERVLLVGEAAGIDPVTGEGIAQAVQYGHVAGSYLARKFRERDSDFSDWPRAVRHSSVGRDLLVRSALLRLAYGGPRSSVERFLAETPELLHLGFSHFAGRRYAKGAVLSVLRRTLGAHAAKGGIFPVNHGLSTTREAGLP